MSNFADQTSSLSTPCLVIDNVALSANIADMASTNPGVRLRPHVKAFKCTSLARRLADNGHTAFTCATVHEMNGMIDAGLGSDLLLANESLDVARLQGLAAKAATADAKVAIAVDSSQTIAACVQAGIANVFIDVNVGLPRCGCAPENVGALADEARSHGLQIDGVMGYEGHLMMVSNRAERIEKVAESMALLAQAAATVGTSVISAGGTGTFDTNTAATEIQAGSYTLMDTHYDTLDLPFRQALWIEATIISINAQSGYVVADAGLKAMGMDHGNPTWPHGKVWFCSDEHITMAPVEVDRWSVGDHIRLAPAHVDPTVAKHPSMWLVDGDNMAEWPVDLRHW